MPTNPLWIEHTERAAWDTVQSLRVEIERERRRLEQLMRLQPMLPKLNAALEIAARDHAIKTDDGVGIIEALCEKIRAADETPPPAPPVAPPEAPPEPRSARRPTNLSHPVRWFARMLERERQSAGRDGERPDPADRARLVRGLELRVASLAAARPSELFESAVEIGSLALSLARIARRSEDD
jgi:hypothetical protein